MKKTLALFLLLLPFQLTYSQIHGGSERTLFFRNGDSLICKGYYNLKKQQFVIPDSITKKKVKYDYRTISHVKWIDGSIGYFKIISGKNIPQLMGLEKKKANSIYMVLLIVLMGLFMEVTPVEV